MDTIRPMQMGLNQRVLEQNRRFYFTVSATLGIHLIDGTAQVDAMYLKDAFQGNPDDPPLLDIGFPKPCGEFLVSGSFHAPGQIPVTGGEVRVQVGKLKKEVCLFGKRQWKQGVPTRPEKMVSLPLIYQNAFGGEGFDLNPAGKGFKDGLLPLIETSKRLVGSQKDTPVPASFCALDMMDPRRQQHRGTYKSDYRETYFPGHPADMNWKLFMLTPEDQWNDGYFKGDESYLLENMHPDLPKIEGQFPGLYARCFIKQKNDRGDAFGEIPLNLDTLWFFPEKLLGLLIFRGVTEVGDDEAEDITHILGAYEYRSQAPRSLAYYETALDKRIKSDDVLLKLLTTSDLIPEDHPCAMELLMEMAESEKPAESQLVKNTKAKSDAMKKAADEEMEKAARKAESQMDKIEIPDEGWAHIPEDTKAKMPGKKGGLSIRDMMKKKPESAPDPDIERMKQKMDEILPGITSGDVKKMDMKHFSFDKLERITAVSKSFSKKKKGEAMADMEKEFESARREMNKQAADLDQQIAQLRTAAQDSPENLSKQVAKLEEARTKMQESAEQMKLPDLDNLPRQPLPRVDAESIMEQFDRVPPFPPELAPAMQHVKARKDAGIADETTRRIEEKIRGAQKKYDEEVEKTKALVRDHLANTEKNFKEGYLLAAHHMDEGLAPHRKPVEKITQRFLNALANNEDVSNRDWACIDLEGQDLAGVDLSFALLEQVNFKNANLRGANLSKANLARSCLDGADLSKANLKAANIGAVSGIKTCFVHADMTGARLSKGRFKAANFKGAQMEGIEAMDVNFIESDLSDVSIKNVFFMNARMWEVKFTDATVNLSMFIKPEMTHVDFSGTAFSNGGFVDCKFGNVCFDGCELSSCAFFATSPDESGMEEISFRKAKLYLTNLMDLNLKRSNFSGADLTQSFFWNADMSGADLSGTRAKMASFRKTKLTNANLENMDMPQGSLAKAHLAGASFKGANLCQTDFLRSTITDTDFRGANLDMTLIENWRPK